MSVALSQTERANARYLLGYSLLDANQDPRTYLPAVPAGLQDGSAVFENNVRSILDTRSYTLVTDLIDQIFAFRTQIADAASTLIASRIEGAVSLNPKRMYEMWQEDYRLCQLLASLLMVRVYWHPAMATSYGTMKVTGG